ncbi:YgaP-like transmembrane domain [Arenibaculum pallidiluteum]|uniref:YgaP-like transmembrane domain n=1 Tax=Arenibaculum pallidiluteum TaxID=2812559 RepID=UPI001A95C635|nr:YgaP-like transmembrane domain [Arenibaculum pallidiluteum]
MAGDPFRAFYESTFGGTRNVGRMEGLASIGLGLGFAAGGLQKADARGALMGLIGAYLVARGMSRHCPIKAVFQDGATHRLADGSSSDNRSAVTRS